MDFSAIRWLLVASLATIATGCGGGDGDDELGSSGSGGSLAESAYDGDTNPAVLTQTNRNRFLRALFSDRTLNSLPESFNFESYLDTLRNRIVSNGSTEFSENIACFPGSANINATTNGNFSFFNITINYSGCDVTSATLNGNLRISTTYEGTFPNGANKLSESLTYRNLELARAGSSLAIDGEEDIEFDLLEGSREIEKEITFSTPDSEEQGFYDNVEFEIENSDPFPGNLESLSGRYFDSGEGSVTLSAVASGRHDGNVAVITGAGATSIRVDYEEQTAEVIIEVDTNGDGAADFTESLTRSAFDALVNP